MKYLRHTINTLMTWGAFECSHSKESLRPHCISYLNLLILSFQFNGEPRSYTRFNLTQNMEGDNSQVEMKLSSDMDEEAEANGVGENKNQHNGPYYPSKLSQRSPKNICFIVIGILFLFISGKKMCCYHIQYLHTYSVFVGCGNFLYRFVYISPN